MPLDHLETAKKLERIARLNNNLAKIVGTVVAIRSAAHSEDILITQANWHLEQHAKQAQTATAAEIQDLTKSAAQSLLNPIQITPNQ